MTVAVKVTGCPETEGFVPEVKVVVEVLAVTVCVAVAVEAVKLVSPE